MWRWDADLRVLVFRTLPNQLLYLLVADIHHFQSQQMMCHASSFSTQQSVRTAIHVRKYMCSTSCDNRSKKSGKAVRLSINTQRKKILIECI